VKYLRGYAVLEVLFALFMTYQTMSRTNDMITPVQALGLMASVYLLIRGFDNYKKDLDERNKKTEQTAEAA
jgi:hypothetical protein